MGQNLPLHIEAEAAAQPVESLRREDLAALRLSMAEAARNEVGPGDRTVVAQDVNADGVPARLYRSPGGTDRVAVFVHGGGWALGSLDTHDGWCREIAGRAGCAVLAAGYRLAPEHPHPAALEDVERVVAWARGSAGLAAGLDAASPAIVGESAGGQIAAVAVRRARDAGAPYACQVLVYPVIDPFADYPPLDEFGLTRQDMAFFWRLYVPDPLARAHADVAPLLAADLAGLPPTLVISAELDILRDEAERYADALAAAGVPVTSVRYRGVGHSFARKVATVGAAHDATDQIAGTLRRVLET